MPEHSEDDSTFLRHVPCDNCGSRDNNSLYTDGHEYCFGCSAYKHGDGGSRAPSHARRKVAGLIEGEVAPLLSRGITQETCAHFGYAKGEYRGKKVQIAPYYDKDGTLVAQKVRSADKKFAWLGDPKDAMPFGYNAFPHSGKMMVITEGEVDALAMSQVQNNSWPVWSLSCGADKELNEAGETMPATKIRKYFAKHREALLKFEKVVLMFDSDSAGRHSARAAAEVLGPAAVIAELPLKDAAEMLKAGRTEELLNAMWRAQPYRPDGIVSLASIRDSVLAAAEPGIPWPWESMTKATYGRRLGEVHVFGAGTGVGKTEVFLELVKHTTMDLGESCALFMLEQPVRETGLRLAGKYAGKRFHLADGTWQQEELVSAWNALENSGKLWLYDSFGICDWETIEDRIRFLAGTEDVRHFFIDHLTALASTQDDERKALELIMAAVAMLAKELNIIIYLISHLATPEGKPHEEGGRVMIRHLKGSRAIGFWAHGIFGLERDQQQSDLFVRSTITLRQLKSRWTGFTGILCGLHMDEHTGLLTEVDLSEHDAPTAASTGDEFNDQSAEDGAQSDF